MTAKQLPSSQNFSFLQKNPIKSPIQFSFKSKQLSNQSSLRQKLTSLNLKTFKLKIKQNISFSDNKIKKRPNSIVVNFFRPNSAHENHSSINQHINMKNINLIKQNLKNLQKRQEHTNIFEGKSQRKIRIHHNNFPNKSYLHFSSQKYLGKFNKRKQNGQQVFLFEQKNSQKNRKFSHRLDKSKYFKVTQCKKQSTSKTSLSNRSRVSTKLEIKKQDKIIEKKKYIFFDEIIPVIKQRNKKPKTAGGFLKNYQTKHLFFCHDDYHVSTQIVQQNQQ